MKSTRLVQKNNMRPDADRSRRDFLHSSTLATFGAVASLGLAGGALGAAAQASRGKIWIDVEDRIGKINRNIYGHFFEHVGSLVYDGTWVGEDSSIPNDGGIRKDAIETMRRLKPPVARWPGGCFADTYHWRDGIGPRSQRPKRWATRGIERDRASSQAGGKTESHGDRAHPSAHRGQRTGRKQTSPACFLA